MASSYGWAGVVFGLLAIVGFIYWAYRRATNREVQLEQETRARLESEVARKREQEIRDALDKVRSESGPAVPDFVRVRPPDPPNPGSPS